MTIAEIVNRTNVALQKIIVKLEEILVKIKEF